MTKKENYLNALSNCNDDVYEFESFLISSDYSLVEIRKIFELIEDEFDDCMEFNTAKKHLKCYNI